MVRQLCPGQKWQHFDDIWVIDFEFIPDDFGGVEPVCLVAHELRSGRRRRIWFDAGVEHPPPFRADDNTLVVAYAASAEMSCYRALGWSYPAKVLDLFAEYRVVSNGSFNGENPSLLAACGRYGLPTRGAAGKEEMRSLILSASRMAEHGERMAILDYCERDVVDTAALFLEMTGAINVRQALLRGEYAISVAEIEAAGTPVDVDQLEYITENRDALLAEMAKRDPLGAEVYDGSRFVKARFESLVTRLGVRWPRLRSGALALDKETFEEISLRDRSFTGLYELRKFAASSKGAPLPLGPDGRVHSPVMPYKSVTGRNQPPTRKFIFGRSAVYRNLIRPEPGYSLAYVDYSQQEFGIGAALSGDSAMWQAYESGDPYMQTAIRAGRAPTGATKATHGRERELFKTVCLGIQYGMGAATLSERLGASEVEAGGLIQAFRSAFPQYQRWIEALVESAYGSGQIEAALGWRMAVERSTKRGTLLNFPLQANGAEILRLACNLLRRAGVKVLALVHDAVLIEAPTVETCEAVAATGHCLAEASRGVLGRSLRYDADEIHYPDHYTDPRGDALWAVIKDLRGAMA